ncbi:hypothetical protein BH23VER1_BH23VER1_34300 [soil metagenome]
MGAKAAALALAEANRMASHSESYELAVDDRDGVAPPGSGWVLLDFHGDDSYFYQAQVVAVRFGVEGAFLISAEEERQGMVGANPVADRSGYFVRVIPLEATEARWLADVVFWLDRVRSRAKGKDIRGGGGTTADGWASLHFVAPGGVEARQVAVDTAWATEAVSARFTGAYDPEVCLNLVDFLLRDGLPEHLGERWIEALAEAGVTRDAVRKALAVQCGKAFEIHNDDPVPATVLRRVVKCVGDEGLVGLRDVVEEIGEGLPAVDGEDRKFARLANRFRRDHFGNWLVDNGHDDKNEDDYAEFLRMREARRLEPGPVLRGWVKHVLEQLEAMTRKEKLVAGARSEDAQKYWALQQLAERFPAAYAEVVSEWFREAEQDGERVSLLQAVAGVDEKAAVRLAGGVGEKAEGELLVEAAAVEAEFAPERLEGRVNGLFSVVEAEEEERPDYHLRGRALALLERADLDAEDEERLEGILLKGLTPRQGGKMRGNFQGSVDVLLARDGRDRYWEAFKAAALVERQEAGAGSLFGAVAELAEGRGDEGRKTLEAMLRRRLEASSGMMNHVFLMALAYDLRGLREDVEAFASGSGASNEPKVPKISGLPGRAYAGLKIRAHSARVFRRLQARKPPRWRRGLKGRSQAPPTRPPSSYWMSRFQSPTPPLSRSRSSVPPAPLVVQSSQG